MDREVTQTKMERTDVSKRKENTEYQRRQQRKKQIDKQLSALFA